MIRRLAAVPRDRFHLTMMLALTFSTGVIDAVGYLGLDRVFTGNMTGNVVILGMAVVGADDLPVVGPVLALVGFLGGAALGGRVMKSAGPAWTRATTALFGLVAVIILGIAVVMVVLDDGLDEPAALTITTALGAAMGIQAATARFIAVRDVTTVVVTSTITGLAADSVLGAGTGKGHTLRRVSAVLLILAGAAAGATLLKWELAAGLVLSGVITLVVTGLGVLHTRHAPSD